MLYQNFYTLAYRWQIPSLKVYTCHTKNGSLKPYTLSPPYISSPRSLRSPLSLTARLRDRE